MPIIVNLGKPVPSPKIESLHQKILGGWRYKEDLIEPITSQGTSQWMLCLMYCPSSATRSRLEAGFWTHAGEWVAQYTPKPADRIIAWTHLKKIGVDLDKVITAANKAWGLPYPNAKSEDALDITLWKRFVVEYTADKTASMSENEKVWLTELLMKKSASLTKK